MAFTSLETIAQKLQEKKQDDLEAILKVSGSAMTAKNEYGITVVDDANIASSLLFKPLHRPKINNEELIKAVDVDVKELKPQIPKQVKNLIPKELYDDQVKQNDILTKQVDDLNNQVNDLTSQLSDLQSQVTNEVNNRLTIEQTNDALVNQLNSLKQTIDDFVKQIQSAVQKSVDESILRASLQAQNVGLKSQIEGLIKQVDSLNSISEGLQSQLGAVQQQKTIESTTSTLAAAAGGDIINTVIIAKFKKKDSAAEEPIVGAIRQDNSATYFRNGDEVILQNTDVNPVSITLSAVTKENWLKPEFTTFTMTPNEIKSVKLLITPNALTSPLAWSYRYNSPKGFKISVRRADQSVVVKEYDTCLMKHSNQDFGR